MDYVGFGLVALGLGTLQVVLDEGQREDWFGLSFHRLLRDGDGRGPGRRLPARAQGNGGRPGPVAPRADCHGAHAGRGRSGVAGPGALALFPMTSFDLMIDYRTATWARIYQSIGLAFLFLPVHPTAYAPLPAGKSDAAPRRS